MSEAFRSVLLVVGAVTLLQHVIREGMQRHFQEREPERVDEQEEQKTEARRGEEAKIGYIQHQCSRFHAARSSRNSCCERKEASHTRRVRHVHSHSHSLTASGATGLRQIVEFAYTNTSGSRQQCSSGQRERERERERVSEAADDVSGCM